MSFHDSEQPTPRHRRHTVPAQIKGSGIFTQMPTPEAIAASLASPNERDQAVTVRFVLDTGVTDIFIRGQESDDAGGVLLKGQRPVSATEWETIYLAWDGQQGRYAENKAELGFNRTPTRDPMRCGENYRCFEASDSPRHSVNNDRG